MHCNNLRLVLGLGLVRVGSRVRVRVKVRVSVLVRVSIRTNWVVNFALFRCYRPVIYTRPGLVLGLALGLVSLVHLIAKTKLTLILTLTLSLTLTFLTLLPRGQSRVCSNLGPPLRGMPKGHANLGPTFGGLCLCLSVRQDISGTTREIFTNFLCMLPVARPSSAH